MVIKDRITRRGGLGLASALLGALVLVAWVANADAEIKVYNSSEMGRHLPSGGPTPTATPTCTLNENYSVTRTTGNALIPGVNQVPGLSCNTCVVRIEFPFNYLFYHSSVTGAYTSNKGNMQFISAWSAGDNTCLQSFRLVSSIVPYWDDTNTFINDSMGVYTTVVGTAPNRIFVVEWRAGQIANDATFNYEVLLYEGQPRFDFVYGDVTQRGFSATIGAQDWPIASHVVQWSCNTQSIQPGDRLIFDRRTCP
jgi:hypothetical protein